MTIMQSSSPPEQPSIHWATLLQLILSLLAAVILLGAAVAIVISAISQYFTKAPGASDPTQSLMVAASLAFAGILVLPSAWYAWKHIAQPEIAPALHPERRLVGWILTVMVLILTGGALLLGNWAIQNNRLTWLLLPPLNLIATGLPTLWMIYFGTRGLIQGNPRRSWGVFASGLVLSPLIALILELLLLVFMGVLAIFWIMLNPSLANQFNVLVYRLQSPGQNLNSVLNLLVPFLFNPGIVFILFASFSVMGPLIEEALKPIGVWFLSAQKLSPAQGFAYGVLSGAAFGLFENLGNTSGATPDWALLASARISALMLHSFTTGIVGWALACAWSERRYVRLGVTYAVAVVIHGLWNAMALLNVASSLQSLPNLTLPAYLQPIGSFSTWGIIILGSIVLLLFIGSNAFLRRSQLSTSPPMPDTIPASFPANNLHPRDKLPDASSGMGIADSLPGDDHLSETDKATKRLHNGENSHLTTG